ncbi:hypothetical protein ACFTSF_11585 [Kribbella sp. NPDC056951]|uniref:hypothetical protein n=1 Tax=Kribbella sp. NPDC056951 TaxID=3345978 RepID=UPI003637EC8D
MVGATVLLLVAVFVTMINAMYAVPSDREPGTPLPPEYGTWHSLFTVAELLLLVAAVLCFVLRKWVLGIAAGVAVPLAWYFLLLTSVGPT